MNPRFLENCKSMLNLASRYKVYAWTVSSVLSYEGAALLKN